MTPCYRITNGKIVTPYEVLTDLDLIIDQGRIHGFVPAMDTNSLNHSNRWENHQIIDARGGWITPGLIDLHSDYIEHLVAPRPTSMMDLEFSLRVSERECAIHGITTMFHSLSLYKSTEFITRAIREPKNLNRFLELISLTHHSDRLIRHRFHARYELDNVNQVQWLMNRLESGQIHLLSFMDHTPGQGQYRDLELYKKTIKGYRSVSDEQVTTLIAEIQAKDKLTLEQIAELGRFAVSCDVAVASHDDDTLEKLHLVKDFGTRISEFPITLEVAVEARSLGMDTVAGAPNVLLGGSHSGNLGAAQAILQNAITILCSDYYPASMLQAVMVLIKQYQVSVVEAFKLVTVNPAKAVGIDAELGSIEEGKLADLLILHERSDGTLTVTTTFLEGIPVVRIQYPRNNS
jgi:phosphonate metabolism protein PhnM